MGKKKKSPPPRTKRMKQNARLESARRWLPAYIVRGYKKRYGVDYSCALKELKMIGVDIDPEYEKQLRLALERKRKAKKLKKKKEAEAAELSQWGVEGGHDEHYAFIAGFTSGGAAYGVTWEEWEAMEAREDSTDRLPYPDYDDDIPF